MLGQMLILLLLVLRPNSMTAMQDDKIGDSKKFQIEIDTIL